MLLTTDTTTFVALPTILTASLPATEAAAQDDAAVMVKETPETLVETPGT